VETISSFADNIKAEIDLAIRKRNHGKGI
jgi:hypothetical protein